MTDVGSGLSTAASSDTAAQDALSEACPGETAPADIGFTTVFCSPAHDYQQVVDTVREQTNDAPLLGASSAGEFTEAGAVKHGVAITAITGADMEFHTGLGTGLAADIETAASDAVSEMPDPQELDGHAVGINLHDGLLGRGDEVVLYAYQNQPMPYVGGSAGDDRQLEETAVFVDDAVATDAIGVGMLVADTAFGTAAAHGHDAVSGGLRVTAADGSTVHELDGQPAFDVWADTINEHVDEADVRELAGGSDRLTRLLTIYEFGVQTGAEEYKIRWPGLTTDTHGALKFATNIPEGTELFVLSSAVQDQYAAQQAAVERAVDATDTEIAGALSFNCICQADIMGEEFADGIQEVGAQLDAALAGMQVYGEVNMDADDMRGYHNATSSVLVIPE